MKQKPRRKFGPLNALKKLQAAEHEYLSAAGAKDAAYWYTKDKNAKKLIAKFKDEVKGLHYDGQHSRCCYCSTYTHDHKALFDLEHVLAQSIYPQFMFSLANIAIACKPCNLAKLHDDVLVGKLDDGVPTHTDSYSILHPQIDEWTDHFEFDDLGRIQPTSTKGKVTFKTCKLESINSAQLADEFATGPAKAKELFLAFFRAEEYEHRVQLVSLIRHLANESKLASAISIVDRIEDELRAERTRTNQQAGTD